MWRSRSGRRWKSAASIWRPSSRRGRACGTGAGTVGAMRGYTVMRAADAPDYTGDAPGAFLGYGRPMGAEQVALNVRALAPHTAHVPPGGDPSAGHSYRTIEEIYFVLSGEVTMKLRDEGTSLGPHDAGRI